MVVDGYDEGPPAAIDRLLEECRRGLDRVRPEDLPAAVAAGALVVDTRPVEQRERDGELPGAVVVDRNVLEWRLDPGCAHRLPGIDHDPERRVVVVCNEGYSSSLAARTLQRLGLVNATDLAGGFQAWLHVDPREGLPAARSGTAPGMIRRVVGEGLLAGAVGVAVMTLGEKLEQRLTGRPDSYVPARVLERLTALPEQAGGRAVATNWAMHHGQAALVGVVRSVMAHAGLRGPVASAKFAVIRLTTDQVLENATGVGAPPQTWPRGELAVDLLHKGVYAAVTGLVADALAARNGPGPGQRHAAVAPGRVGDVGPLPREAVGTP